MLREQQRRPIPDEAGHIQRLSVTNDDAHIECIFYTVDEARRVLRLGRTGTYKLISSGQIKTVKIGGKRLIPGVEILRFAKAVIEGGE